MNYGSLPDYLSFIIACAALFVTWSQLGKLVDSNDSSKRNNAIQTVQLMLTLYQLITDAKSKMDAQSIIVSELRIKHESTGNVTKTELNKADLLHDIRIQDYLNSLDTLCSCFLKDAELENQYKSDYRTVIDDALKYYGSYFGIPPIKYRNLQDIQKKWSRE